MEAAVNPNNPPQEASPYRGFVDAVRGPIMLVALGILMAADQLGRFGIDRTWPALLILFGLLKVASFAGGTRE